MITSFIQGGLGNQLFQIAAGLSLAKDLSVDFALHDGQHHLPLQGSRIEVYKTNILKGIQFKDLSKLNLTTYYWDRPEYKPLNKIDNQVLIGYFQSEKYFNHYSSEIKELFQLSKVDTPKGSVALHIRRGDYLNNSHIHPILTADYYYKALEIIGDYERVYIFTDSDIPEGLKIKNSILVEKASDYDHLCFMASCDHNIIANSTFSWWAAYLNKNDNTVIAPKLWFGPAGPQNWQDIYCEGWQVI